MKTCFFLINFAFFFMLALSPVCSQVDFEYEEKMDDPYMPLAERDKIYTAPYSKRSPRMNMTQVNVAANGMNILNDAANEPSLAIDPNDPNRMVIGWRQFENIESNFRQAGMAYTFDGGLTWTFPGPIEPERFRSDPVLETDSDGTFYYNSLSDDFTCDVFKSNDLVDWSDKTFAFGGDKQWMVVDKTNTASNGNIYAFWKTSSSVCTPGSFTRSTNEGTSYEDCASVPSNPTRGTLNIGPDGELYACGGTFNGFAVLKSTSARNPNEVVDWDFSRSVDLKGSLGLYSGPNPNGMLGQFWIATNHADGPYRGEVYVVAPVFRNDSGDPCDVMFAKSSDGGETWEEAIAINDDNTTTAWQWFPTMSVAPNGRIDMVWLDTRDDPGTFMSSLYYSSSLDGGETWSANQKLSESFNPHVGWPSQNKIGDYYHLISTNEGAHLAWAATFNGGQDVFYSFIEAAEITSAVSLPEVTFTAEVYPNPASDRISFTISSQVDMDIQYEIIDLVGQNLHKSQSKRIIAGDNHITIPTQALNNLSQGIYMLKIQSKNETMITKKFIVN